MRPLNSTEGLLACIAALAFGALVGYGLTFVTLVGGRRRLYVRHDNYRVALGSLIIMYVFLVFLDLVTHVVYRVDFRFGVEWMLLFPAFMSYGISVGYRLAHRSTVFPPVTPLPDE